jgi:hypothetical protein
MRMMRGSGAACAFHPVTCPMTQPAMHAARPRPRPILAALLSGALLASLPAHATGHATARPATTSFHFDHIPVRSALQLIAEEGQFNLVVPDSVQGTITLRLDDVTWEQALEVVMRLKGLRARVDSGAGTVTVSGG